MNTPHKILAILELVKDRCLVVPDHIDIGSLLQGRGVTHGGYCRCEDLVSFKSFYRELIEQIDNPDISERVVKMAGGGAANVLRAMSILGNCDSSYISVKGEDKAAQFCTDALERLGIKCTCPIERAAKTLRSCCVFWKEKRTMVTYADPNAKVLGDDLSQETFQHGYKLLLLEGYGVFAENQLRTASEYSEGFISNRAMILPGGGVMENKEYRKNLVELISSGRLTHLIGNLDEFKALTQWNCLDGIFDWLSKHAPALCVVCTAGKEGGWIFAQNQCTRYRAVEANCIDDTGAGDAFTGGFLYGVLQDYSLALCADIGALMASYVVANRGPQMAENQHELARQAVADLVAASNYARGLV